MGDKMKYCIYCHTNKINGKRYVGMTSQKPENRWNNGRGYINNKHFYRAIEKYGWHNFTHEILYTNLSKEEAEKLEIKIIAEYDSANYEKGYNIDLGGNGSHKFSELTKKRISEALKGHGCSEETRRKISLANTGRPSPLKGKKMSPENVKKNSECHKGLTPWNKGRAWSPEERAKMNGKAVKCVETGIVYRTAHEASEKLGIDFSSICKCRRGEVKRAGGYHWIDAEELPNG